MVLDRIKTLKSLNEEREEIKQQILDSGNIEGYESLFCVYVCVGERVCVCARVSVCLWRTYLPVYA